MSDTARGSKDEIAAVAVEAALDDGNVILEELVENEKARVAEDQGLLKEARDAAEYVEGKQKVVESTVKAPNVA
jgi:hypothetical protein